MILLITPGILTYKTLDNPIIEMCNLLSGMNDQISDAWAQFATLFCLATVLIYVANFIILHKFGIN